MELRDPRPPDLTLIDAERPFAERAREILTGGDAVPAAVAPPAGHPRFPLMDGIRAAAALAVLADHAAFASTDWGSWYGRFTVRLDVGVAIFFALAGFLLFRPYLAEFVDGVPAPTFSRYLFRRGLRVLPAYWVALTVLALAGLIKLGPGMWEHFALVQLYDTSQRFSGLNPAWSLATEVAFYAALPALVLALRAEAATTRAGRLRAAGFLAAGLWLACNAFRLVLAGLDRHHTSPLGLTLVGELDWFALGMGLAVASVAYAGDRPRPRVLARLERSPGLSWLAALALFTFASLGLGASGHWGLTHTTLAAMVMHISYGLVALFLIAPAVFPGSGRALVHRLLAHPVVSGLGLISYGIFLYNAPLTVWLARSQLSGMWSGRPFLGLLLATLAVTIPAAMLSYRLIERPLLRLKDWRLQLPAAAAAPRPAEADRPAA
jgi:peptidoglycan/LPS O-acetylase OafA/YrhL